MHSLGYNLRAMTTTETGEQALLSIISSHLEVTEKLLEHYVKLAGAVRHQPEVAQHLPAFEAPQVLSTLLTSTRALHQRVQSMLGQK